MIERIYILNAKKRGSICSEKLSVSERPVLEGAVIRSESDFTDNINLSKRIEEVNVQRRQQQILPLNIPPHQFYSRMVELDDLSSSR